MKIGVIGCGNMGGALVAGMLKNAAFAPSDILVFDADGKKADAAASQWGAVRVQTAEGVISASDIIILAVKPQDIEGFLGQAKGALNGRRKALVSVAAGIRVELFRKHLPETLIARVMPNTPAIAGEGASAIYFDGSFADDIKGTVMKVFSSIGLAEVVKKEEMLDAVTGLSGSGPAYVLSFINALADGGVLEGLPRETALRLSVQTVLGTAKMASQEKDSHPIGLRDKITSPGGTTAAGLLALEEGAFNAAVIRAVRAAANRSRQLGGK